MLARLHRALCLSVLAASLSWLTVWWARLPWLALLGLCAPLIGYGAILAAEFVLLARHGADRAPRPAFTQLVMAWWSELCHGIRVFLWRQPFRSNAEPDYLPSHGRRGIVFVHGMVCNRGFWAPWMRRARSMGVPCLAIDLEPVFGPIDAYVPIVDAAVARMRAATGHPPVLVCHSMGGLAARAWLCTPGAAGQVAHVVTIGTPHAGTWLARFSQARNGRQMRQGSDWLAALARAPQALGPAHFTCWYSNCDNIVFPASTSVLPGADARFIAGQAHVALAFHPTVMRETLALV